MKALATLLALMPLAIPAPVNAQELRKLESTVGQHISLIDNDRREWQGRLLTVANEMVTIELDSTPRRFTMDEIIRIDAHGDGLRDGAIKGVVFGAVIGLLVRDARVAVGSAATYGLIGVGLDALNKCTHTVYRRPPGAAVSLRW